MRKFKVGDMVKVKKGKNTNSLSWLHYMELSVGNIFRIARVSEHVDCTHYELEGIGVWFDETWLTPVNEQITIERHGQKVVAKMGKKVGVAKCAPEDEFDMFEGSLIALNRLFGRQAEEVKPKFKEGDIVKVIKDDMWIDKDTIGRVEVVHEENGERILVKFMDKDGGDVSWWIDADKCKLVLKAEREKK